MPKISSDGVPSYDGAGDEVGVVTNATGEQFDLSDQPVDEEREQGDDTQRRDDASSLDVRDQQQDEGTGAKASAKAGTPTVKQTSTKK